MTVGAIAELGQPAEIDHDAVAAQLKFIAPAYSWDGETWDETTLLAAALVYSPELHAARAGAQAAQAEAKAARVRPGPTLTLTAEYAFNPAESSPWLFGLATEQLLDIGGRRRMRVAEADIAAKVSAYSLEDAVWKARSEVATAIAAVRSSSAIAARYDEIAPLRSRQVASLSRQLAEGKASSLDLERIRQSAANDTTAAAGARSESRAARLFLAKAIGVDVAAIESLALTQGADEAIAELSPDLQSKALQARPEIFDAVVAYDRSEEAVRAAIAAQYPEIRIGPGYTWERGLSKLPFNLALAFPSADFGAAGIAAAEARREEAARVLEAAVAAAQRNIELAVETYRSAHEVYEIARNQTLPTARAIAAQADRALDAGAIDRATWVDAKIGALTAAIDFTRAEQNLIAARIALESALRRKFENTPPRQTAGIQKSGALEND